MKRIIRKRLLTIGEGKRLTKLRAKIEEEFSQTYISVCKQTIARNRKLPHEKRVGPIRVCRGKYGKSSRNFGMGMKMHEGDYVSICYASPEGVLQPMPWGARVWIQISRKRK